MPKLQRTRLELLDGLRIVASFEVVFWHRQEQSLFGVRFGVLLFLVILFGLAASSGRQETLGDFAKRRGAYLLWPWVRWSVLCLVFFGLRDMNWGIDPMARLGWTSFLVGGHTYYWFLPYAAALVIGAKGLQMALKPLRPELAVGLMTVAGVASTGLVCWFLGAVLVHFPFHPWIELSPSLFYGVAMGQCLRVQETPRRSGLLAGIALAAWIPWLLWWSGDWDDVPSRFAITAAFAAVGFGWRVPVPRWIRSVSMTTFGVYLVHPFVEVLGNQVIELATLPPFVDTGLVWCVSSAIVFGLGYVLKGWPEAWQAPKS